MASAVQAATQRTNAMNAANTQVAATKLAPVFIDTNGADPLAAAAAAIFDGKRARPACAYTQDGRAVVCSARTARKNGWTIVARTWR
jgi:uncharacterized membrane protein